MFNQVLSEGYKSLEALIRMPSKDPTHVHHKMKMWKINKNIIEEGISSILLVGPTVSQGTA